MRQCCQEVRWETFMVWVRLSREKTERPYTLHPTQSFKYLQTESATELRIRPALHDAKVRVFSPRAFVFVIGRLFVCVLGGRSRRHNNSSRQQQSLSNIFVVTVIVIAHGRSLRFLPSRGGSQLVSAASKFYWQPPNPSTASTCILPGVELVVQYIYNGNYSEDKQDNGNRKEAVQYPKAVGSNPLRSGLRISQLKIRLSLLTRFRSFSS